MPRALTEGGRVELRLRPEDKATLTRAASLKRLDLTGYILGAVLPKAEADIAEAERLTLSERDSLRVLALLENPPAALTGSCAPRKPASPCHDGASSGRKRRSPSGMIARPSTAATPISTSICKNTRARTTKAAARNASSPRPPTRRRASSASTRCRRRRSNTRERRRWRRKASRVTTCPCSVSAASPSTRRCKAVDSAARSCCAPPIAASASRKTWAASRC